MSAGGFYLRILALFILATLVGLLTRWVLGAQGYRLYAWAAALLVILPFLSRAMKERMQTVSLKPRRRFWLLVPLFLLAVIRIGYWVAFFHSQELATMMHVIASQLGFHAGNSIYLPHAIAVLIAVYFLWRLGPSAEKRRAKRQSMMQAKMQSDALHA